MNIIVAGVLGIVAGENPRIFDPGQGRGPRDGGAVLHGEEGDEDAGVASVVVIRGVPEGFSLAQRLDHSLDVAAIQQVLVGDLKSFADYLNKLRESKK